MVLDLLKFLGKKSIKEKQKDDTETSLSLDDSRCQTKAGVSARIKTNELRVMAAVTLPSVRHHKMAVKHASLCLSLPQSSAVSLPLASFVLPFPFPIKG